MYSSWYRRMVTPFSIETSGALLRIMLGAVMITHGYGKVFGDVSRLSGGVGAMGFPAPEFFAWAAAISEFFGGIMLILGLFTRFWSAMIGITMFVAAFVAHAADPFQKKELALVYLVVSIVIFLLGPGRASIDHLLFGRRS